MRRTLLTASVALACAGDGNDVGTSSTSSTSSSADTSTGPAESSGSVAPGGSTSSGEATTSSSDGGGDSTGALDRPPTIALVQYDADAHFGDLQHNTAALTAWAEQAIADGATIVVFPEGSSFGYASPTELWCAPGTSEYQGRSCRDVATVAEPLPGGPTSDHWASFAAAHDVTIVYHVLERDGASFHNAIGIVDGGGFVGSYRKRTLYYVDEAYATPGDEPLVIDTPGGRFGMMICIDGTYDGGYYDEYEALGVDGIIIAMDWDDDPYGPAAAISWFRERADVNDVHIWVADEAAWDGTGHYPPGDVPRERNGLDAVAVGVEGVSIHALGP